MDIKLDRDWEGISNQEHPVYDGYILPKFPVLLPDPGPHMRAIRDFASRKSDILLCNYAKTGTNWMYEILFMLLQGKAGYNPKFKIVSMLEAIDIHDLEELPSPRILNTHIPFPHLPQKHVENGYKIIHILRNPKDVMVSWYNHCKHDPRLKAPNFPGTWDEYLSDQCGNIHNFYKGFFEFQKELEAAKTRGDVQNVHTLYYEDLKKDPVKEIRQLAKYLELELNEDIIMEIADKCSFEKLSLVAQNIKDGAEEIAQFSPDGKNLFFRKGTVGDWKNWFTVAQNEMFDAVLKMELKDSSLHFTYNI